MTRHCFRVIVLASLLLTVESICAQTLLQVERAGTTESVPLRTKGSIKQVDIVSLAHALAIETSTDSNGAWLHILLPQKLSFRTGNPWLRSGSKILQLPVPVERTSSNYWTPLEWTIAKLTEQGIEESEYDPTNLTLTLRPGAAVWKGIRCKSDGENSILLTLLLPKGPFVETTAEGNIFTVKVIGAKVVDSTFIVEVPMVLAVTSRQLDADPPQVTLTLSNEIGTVDTLSTRSWRITWSSQSKPVSTPVPNPTTIPPKPVVANSSKIDAAKKRWQIDCVVIDAGHGGHDPGARGNGLVEKNLTLDIAKRFADLLRTEKGLRVVLTRSSDSFVTLQDRGKIANHVGGKLFISIHINAARDKDGSGIETYFLSPAKTPRALEVSKFENEVVQLESDKSAYARMSDEKMILLSMAQAQFLKESQQLADIVQKEAVKRTGLSDRGVDQAGFYVLVGASMPAILFECAFLSNKHDAQLLWDANARQKFADALFTGIQKFRELSK